MLILWRLTLVLRQHSKKRQISPSDYWSNQTGPCSSAPLSVQSSYRYENILQIVGLLGHCIDAKISPKPASEKAWTTVPENRYTSLKIDVFQTAILTLLAPTGDNARASFLVHQVPRTFATVWQYRRMFTQFFLRVWTSKYTCHLMITNSFYWGVVMMVNKTKKIYNQTRAKGWASKKYIKVRSDVELGLNTYKAKPFNAS